MAANRAQSICGIILVIVIIIPMKTIRKERFVRFLDFHLWLKTDGEEQDLGPIEAKKGGLTRAQKIKAVAGKGEWIKI